MPEASMAAGRMADRLQAEVFALSPGLGIGMDELHGH